MSTMIIYHEAIASRFYLSPLSSSRRAHLMATRLRPLRPPRNCHRALLSPAAERRGPESRAGRDDDVTEAHRPGRRPEPHTAAAVLPEGGALAGPPQSGRPGPYHWHSGPAEAFSELEVGNFCSVAPKDVRRKPLARQPNRLHAKISSTGLLLFAPRHDTESIGLKRTASCILTKLPDSLSMF